MLYKQSENVVVRVIGDETILVPINQTGVRVQKIYSLNETARVIWDKIGASKTRDQILQELLREYEYSDKELMIEEISSLLNELQELNFIEVEK